MPSQPAPPGPAPGLAPGLLVASPGLGDPNFAGSVVLMAEHHGEGALGFVVNRPAPISVADVLGGLDDGLRRDAQAAGRAEGVVLVGGPVQPERLWILFRAGAGADLVGAVAVGEELALGGSRELLEGLVRAPRPRPFVLLLGYAGWAPMQAENEIAAGAWVPMPLASDLVFEVPLEKRWETAVRRLGLDPGEFLVGGGGAQA
jgi:putative transcriptional regulator